MSSRVSRYILLCEDRAHERLIRSYLQRCGLPTNAPQLLSKVAARLKEGSNIGWVIDHFPEELEACRKRTARTLLIVVADADDLDVIVRQRQFAGLQPNDPVVLLIPKRNVETWIHVANKHSVNESDDYKKNPLLNFTKEVFSTAASQIYAWTRPNAQPGATCVPSLAASFPEWRKLD